MKILAVDSSAKSAGVAVAEDGRLISECFVNNALTHSRTLMPMVENALSQADLTLKDIDAICVNAGPGSFTGLRIGSATAKGLGQALNKPLIESIPPSIFDKTSVPNKASSNLLKSKSPRYSFVFNTISLKSFLASSRPHVTNGSLAKAMKILSKSLSAIPSDTISCSPQIRAIIG